MKWSKPEKVKGGPGSYQESDRGYVLSYMPLRFQERGLFTASLGGKAFATFEVPLGDPEAAKAGAEWIREACEVNERMKKAGPQ